MRCFIAIELPPEVIKLLAMIIQEIQRKKLIEGKFVEIDNLHLTLKFLGDVNAKTLADIQQALKTVSLSTFTITLNGLGVFTKEHPRILWIDLKGAGIFSLVDDIERVLEAIVSREQRPFAAHVTLARIKRVLSNDFYVLLDHYHVEPKKFIVDHFVLKQSQLTSDGPVYTDIACYQLKNLEN